MAINAELYGRIADIFENGWAVGDGLCIAPGAKGIAEGEHIGIGAHAGIAKEVPGAAHSWACFEDCVGLFRAVGLKAIARTDAGEACTDDDDVEMLDGVQRWGNYGMEFGGIQECMSKRWLPVEFSRVAQTEVYVTKVEVL